MTRRVTSLPCPDSSSQVEFDELWHEITLAAKPNQKGGVDQRTLSLELILIDHQPTQPKPSSDLTKVHHPEAGSISTEGSTFQLIPTPADGSNHEKRKHEH
ncbi:hypothetical protein PGT21_017646 [Puccinia graminis f. sp. tritici]|uniref:Uncharacterized protein n=1 Tax=Puccinia graminis f. sp. tritici TaxID=56615 RepID=A0A5B0LUQ1_PUCGR|nr:hypothetical protein PGT21_017646 [Puccinia graminis f. sp. tritici]